VPSLKALKSVAHNVCSQFGSTLTYWNNDYGINHLARSTNAVGGTVAINLISGTSKPELAGEGIYAIHVLVKGLPSLLSKEGFAHDLLATATATYRFRGSAPVPGGSAAYQCHIELTTKEGKAYVAEISEPNAP